MFLSLPIATVGEEAKGGEGEKGQDGGFGGGGAARCKRGSAMGFYFRHRRRSIHLLPAGGAFVEDELGNGLYIARLDFGGMAPASAMKAD